MTTKIKQNIKYSEPFEKRKKKNLIVIPFDRITFFGLIWLKFDCGHLKATKEKKSKKNYHYRKK